MLSTRLKTVLMGALLMGMGAGVILSMTETQGSEGNASSPESFTVSDNYPNPFEEETSLDVDVSTEQMVRVEVYNLLGQELQRGEKQLSEGYYTLHLSLGHLPAGEYLVNIQGAVSKGIKISKEGEAGDFREPFLQAEERHAGEQDDPRQEQQSQANKKEYLVGFDKQADPQAVQNQGGSVLTSYNNFEILHIDLPENAVQALENAPGVKYVEENREVTLVNQNSPGPASQGSGEGEGDPELTEDNPHWNNTRVGAHATWDTTKGDTMKVAIFDTGVDGDHEALEDNIDPNIGHSSIDIEPDPYNDEHGHGTHVAGIAAGQEKVDGELSPAIGMAPEAQLVSVKVLSSGGSGSTDGIIEGVDWCIDTDNCNVINMSLGGGGYNEAFEETLEEAGNEGIVVITAAGNEGYDGVDYPGAYESTVAVAASDVLDERAFFSSVGPEVDIIAPGWEIFSAYLDDGYRIWGGTSMSSPAVAGGAAQIWAKYPDLSNDEVEDTLLHYVEDLGLPDDYQGEGLMRLDSAFGVPQGHIEGTVTHKETGVAIEDANIFAATSGVISTDSDGDYFASYIPVGDNYVFGHQDGFQYEIDSTVNVSEDDTAEADLALEQDPAFEGIHYDIDVAFRSQGRWERFTVNWDVEMATGELQTVRTILHHDGDEVDRESSSVSGTSASGEHDVRDDNKGELGFDVIDTEDELVNIDIEDENDVLLNAHTKEADNITENEATFHGKFTN